MIVITQVYTYSKTYLNVFTELCYSFIPQIMNLYTQCFVQVNLAFFFLLHGIETICITETPVYFTK